ncbi:pyridoxamine 5'-phosphate oxidase family protein [Massilia sp. H-1]|nr:pyridoxamine 5'-phosphate oxidase family protein [Massilia sp. H-1]
MNGPFHHGELAAQRLAGVVANGGAIRGFMPDQHREFFAALPFMLAASVGQDGAVHAQVLHGAPGFVRTPSETLLEIDTPARFAPGTRLGLLGIDLSNRRRNRVNGVVRSSAPGKLVLEVRESFGNCPRHITLRDLVPGAPAQAPDAVAPFDGLPDDARPGRSCGYLLHCHRRMARAWRRHLAPGRPRAASCGSTAPPWKCPTIPATATSNTLGNLVLEPRAALLFIDFASGDVLELQGRVAIDWQRDGEAVERRWRFQCERGSLARAAPAAALDRTLSLPNRVALACV